MTTRGVRNNKRSYHCYGEQDCFWFHSGNEQVEWPQSVLNKNLNAIRTRTAASQIPVQGARLPEAVLKLSYR
jgi:hypothetical protein